MNSETKAVEPLITPCDEWGASELIEARDKTRARFDAAVADLDSIKSQVEHAQARFHESGQRSDPIWFAKARSALRHKAREHQQCSILLGELSRRLKRVMHEVREKSRESLFIDAARQFLSRDEYTRIWDHVDRMQGPPIPD